MYTLDQVQNKKTEKIFLQRIKNRNMFIILISIILPVLLTKKPFIRLCQLKIDNLDRLSKFEQFFLEVTNVVEKGNHCGGGCGQFGDFDLCYFGADLKSNVFTRHRIGFNCHSTFLLGRNRFVSF